MRRPRLLCLLALVVTAAPACRRAGALQLAELGFQRG
jgi:hypothetical protein